MPETEDFYEILQVYPAALPEVIRASYRSLTLLHHPDWNSSPDANRLVAQINVAYKVLSDPVKRRDYDQIRAAEAGYAGTDTGTGTSTGTEPNQD